MKEIKKNNSEEVIKKRDRYFTWVDEGQALSIQK